MLIVTFLVSILINNRFWISRWVVDCSVWGLVLWLSKPYDNHCQHCEEVPTTSMIWGSWCSTLLLSIYRTTLSSLGSTVHMPFLSRNYASNTLLSFPTSVLLLSTNYIHCCSILSHSHCCYWMVSTNILVLYSYAIIIVLLKVIGMYGT